jgi:hypothetical protein
LILEEHFLEGIIAGIYAGAVGSVFNRFKRKYQKIIPINSIIWIM